MEGTSGAPGRFALALPGESSSAAAVRVAPLFHANAQACPSDAPVDETGVVCRVHADRAFKLPNPFYFIPRGALCTSVMAHKDLMGVEAKLSAERRPSLRVVTWACCGTAVAAIVATAALAASAAPSGSGATPVSQSASKGPPCNYYYEWNGKVRFPLQSDPHATYTYLAASSEAAKDGVGFLVRGQFVHSAWTSWLTYGRGAKPFSGANFVDNFPAGTDDPVEADPGSVDPFGWRQPMLATPRNFTLLFTPRGYRLSAVAPVLDGTAKTDVPDPNFKRYPRGVKFWVLANRNYQALPGYNPGGTRKRTFPVTTAVDLKTGKAVDCQKYNHLPTPLQRSPENPPAKRQLRPCPVRIALKNGSRFVFRGGMSGSHSQYAPKNPARTSSVLAGTAQPRRRCGRGPAARQLLRLPRDSQQYPPYLTGADSAHRELHQHTAGPVVDPLPEPGRSALAGRLHVVQPLRRLVRVLPAWQPEHDVGRQPPVQDRQDRRRHGADLAA